MRGKGVELQHVAVKFGDFTAVHPTGLHIEAGEFFSILGPSGCGKTTLLRAISGFTEPSEGRILIGGEDTQGKGPSKRPTALIFQNLALFPMMSVWENVAFGLEARGMNWVDRKKRAYELLDLVELSDHAHKKPSTLSGGQMQRVAIARALAVEPAVLLLDEPLSALDLKLRQHMRAELRSIQKKTGVTFIYITHDQGEALNMSDRIAVMNRGRIEQVGDTKTVYDAPSTPFVASFVGENNVLHGTVNFVNGTYAKIETPMGEMRGRKHHSNLREGDEAMFFVRPELVVMEDGENAFDATLMRQELEGPFFNLHFANNGQEFSVHMTNSNHNLPNVGAQHKISFDPESCLIMGAGELAQTGSEA